MRFLIIAILLLLPAEAFAFFPSRCDYSPSGFDINQKKTKHCGHTVPAEIRTPQHFSLDEIADFCYSGRRERYFYTGRTCYDKVAEKKAVWHRRAKRPDWKDEVLPKGLQNKDWTPEPHDTRLLSYLLTAGFIFVLLIAGFWPKRK